MPSVAAEVESWEKYLVPSPRGLYDQVVCDSEVERRFVDELEHRADVRLYIKLPGWFAVPTPVGEYNPDWAIVLKERDAHGDGVSGRPLLYLVRETKSTKALDALRPDERRTIICGRAAFEGALGVDYAVVTAAGELS